MIGAALPGLVAALGGDDFAAALLMCGARAVSARHLSVFVFDADLIPRIVLAASLDGSDRARLAGEAFVARGLYRDDPIRATIGGGEGDGAAVLHHYVPAGAEHGRFYADLELSDRLSLFGLARLGWVSVNFYRGIDAPVLNDAALADLAGQAELLHAMVARHLELSKVDASPRDTGAILADRLARLDASLTPRETQVCLHALHGATNAEIADALGVEPTTVSTLRHRAYDRLGVSNIVELFLRCLAA